MGGVSKDNLHYYVLRLGDNAVILGQQVSAWCGHSPILEEDIALANVALDLIGQATNWYNYASEVEGKSKSADDLAFLRGEREFKNVLLVEQPNGDFGQTLMRQFLFDTWHYFLLIELSNSTDTRIAEIATKSLKEVTYHLERSSDLIIRLGDGSEESHEYMQRALDTLWRFTGELHKADALDVEMLEAGIGADLNKVGQDFKEHLERVMERSMLVVPEKTYMRSGGKQGVHSESLGPLLAEMQYLQRSHPGASW